MASEKESEIDVFVTDLNGNLRGKRLPAGSGDKLAVDGVKMPRSVLGVDFWGSDVIENGLVFETGDSDGICLPVTDQLVPAPWLEPPRRQLLATMFNADNTPILADPRQVLNHVVAQYHARGMHPVVALELEFYLLDGSSETTQRPKPPVLTDGHGRQVSEIDGYSMDELDALAPFFAEVREACKQQGISTQTIISEFGPGQYEIDLEHGDDPLRVADNAVMFKRLVKGIARKHGHAATFMAKPYAEHSGNGMHVHFSLLDGDGSNVFDDGSDLGSDLLQQAIAGLIDTMADSMLILAPHQNSYRRFMPGSHAPTLACWGYENRTVAIRVPDSPQAARRIEHRVAGADANPYLVLATVLAGALHGIDNTLQPPAATEGDANDLDNQQPDTTGPALPRNWSDAIHNFTNSSVHVNYLGDTFVGVFSAVKQQEFEKMQQWIPDIEYDTYLGQL